MPQGLTLPTTVCLAQLSNLESCLGFVGVCGHLSAQRDTNAVLLTQKDVKKLNGINPWLALFTFPLTRSANPLLRHCVHSGDKCPPPRHYKVSVVLMCFVVPTLVPWYIWGESLWNSYFLAAILRYAVALNGTWLVNSVAHMYGNRPYDKHISPRQNPLVTLGAIGE